MRLFKLLSGRELPPTADGFRARPWYYRFEFRGRRFTRCLHTADRQVALTRAATVRKTISEAVISRQFERIADTTSRRPRASSLGEILAVYRRRAGIRSSGNNVTSLKSILRHVIGDLTDAQINALPGSTLDGKLLRDYQAKIVPTELRDDARRRATITCNSTVRQARSLVRRDLLAVYKDEGVTLPDLTSFLAVRLFKQPPTPFVPLAPDFLNRLWEALPSMRAAKPNVYRAFLLAEGCGLRRSEAARARWSDVHEVQGQHVLRLGLTKNGHPRLVPLDTTLPTGRSVYADLRSLAPVVPLPGLPTPAAEDYILAGHATERRRHVWDALSLWLRSLGWDRQKKAHELRKHFGSQVAEQHGTRVAAMILGNTEDVFRAHYDALLDVPPMNLRVQKTQ